MKVSYVLALLRIFLIIVYIFLFPVKEQVQADVIITSSKQDERLKKILHGQGKDVMLRL